MLLWCHSAVTIVMCGPITHQCCLSACNTCRTCSTSTAPGGQNCQRDGTASSSPWPWRQPTGCSPRWHRTDLLPWSCTFWATLWQLQNTKHWAYAGKAVRNLGFVFFSSTLCRFCTDPQYFTLCNFALVDTVSFVSRTSYPIDIKISESVHLSMKQSQRYHTTQGTYGCNAISQYSLDIAFNAINVLIFTQSTVHRNAMQLLSLTCYTMSTYVHCIVHKSQCYWFPNKTRLKHFVNLLLLYNICKAIWKTHTNT